jgi:sterol 3beta-glucosyltransferase
LGLRLKQDGHRVRIATHSMFREYITDKGLEFFPLAGDPMMLSEFMVKTKGFIIPTSPDLLMEVIRLPYPSIISEFEVSIIRHQNIML